MKTLRAGRLDPTWQPELGEQITHPQRHRAQCLEILRVHRIEIEDANVGLIKVRSTRGPNVNRYAVRIGEPEQCFSVGDYRVVDRPAMLRHLDAFQPFRKPLRDVFLKETGRRDTTMKSFHRDGPPAEVRQHRSEEHTSELQSPCNLVCRLLLE